MSQSIVGALVLALPDALDDIKANKPLPESQPLSFADMGAAITAAEPQILAWAAFVAAHPGYVRAADRFLAALAAIGYQWPAKWRAVLKMAPGALATASKDLPGIASALKMFQPAPGWDSADGGGTVGYIPGAHR